MKDPRVNKLAKLLINHSCSLRSGERVLVEAINVPNEILIALIREVKAVGGTPLIRIKDDQIIREINSCYSQEDIKLMADCEIYTLRQMDAFIGIRGVHNSNELSDIHPDKLKNILEYYIKPVHLKERNENTKWVAVRWPTSAMAQRAGMSTAAFEDFYFDICTVDYAKMEAAMDPLVELMKRTDEVKIIGPGDSDISFSIKDMPPCKYFGKHNIPDGELQSAPIKNSVNGRIHYNIPSLFYGTTFENVCFDFRDGKIINATGNHPKKINKILSQDEGAKYVGEFAFGLNPMIKKPTKDVLFDEKMWGTIHLTPGNAYKECDNGNRSGVHWDLILDQRSEKEGGKIFFDGVLIRKDGRFVLEELKGLNPESISI